MSDGNGALVVAEKTERPMPIVAGGAVKAIVPQSMEDAYRIANAVVKARMAPKGMETPEACMIAIMHGLEIGLTPMASLQRIAVVNGRPTIWGDGAVGLVRGSGLCEYIKEWIEGDGDQRTAWCETKRRGEPEPVRRSFSVADAKKAGLFGKSGPWTQYPDRMLQMRARAFNLRDTYADVLGGLYLREEIEDSGPVPKPPTPPKIIDVEPMTHEEREEATREEVIVEGEAAAEEPQPTPPAPPAAKAPKPAATKAPAQAKTAAPAQRSAPQQGQAAKKPPTPPPAPKAQADMLGDDAPRSADDLLKELENVVSGMEDAQELIDTEADYLSHPSLQFPGDQARVREIVRARAERISAE